MLYAATISQSCLSEFLSLSALRIQPLLTSCLINTISRVGLLIPAFHKQLLLTFDVHFLCALQWNEWLLVARTVRPAWPHDRHSARNYLLNHHGLIRDTALLAPELVSDLMVRFRLFFVFVLSSVSNSSPHSKWLGALSQKCATSTPR
jgi:hypothetical protein